MKKLFTLLTLIATTVIFAQAPQGFNYQATVRNSSGALIVNQNVNFKFNIMLNSQTSVPIFSETHFAPTDDLGQVNLVIGTGTATTGTFSTINWGTGNYYLGIELNTGSGYVAMGTTQLLSVPYALYANSAGNAQSQGKTSIYLTGNITDAQAATKIAAEFGPYTENIYIRNTTQLTTVDLSALVTISTIEIGNNSNLTNINLNNLITIEDVFYLSQSATLSSLSFPSLLNCSSFNISGPISSLSFPSLIYINKFDIYNFFGLSSNNSTITSLNFPSVQNIGGRFSLSGITSLNSITFPMLHSLSGSISIYESNNGGMSVPNNLTTIGFPALTSCTDFIYGNWGGSSTESSGSISIRNNNPGATIDLSSLTSCNSFEAIYLANLNLSSLTSCPTLAVGSITNFTPFTNLVNCNSLSIGSMPNLTSLSFPSLTTCDSIAINGIPSLTSLSFPMLSSNSGLYLYENALTTANINSLLHKMLTVSPTVAKEIRLYGQTPAAPPTGQGIIDKQTLINAGNTVETD